MSTKNTPLHKWITANALGLGVGFLGILQTGMLIDFGFDWERHWTWVEAAKTPEVKEYLSGVLSMLVGGALLGAAQALILRSRSVPSLPWIAAAVIGFGATEVVVDWPLIALELLGNIPGPVEPIIITVGGSSFAGVLQFLMLRGRGIRAPRWLALWVVGLMVGLVPTALLMVSLETLAITLSWPLEVFLNGAVIAGVAAWISGGALFSALRSIEAQGSQ